MSTDPLPYVLGPMLHGSRGPVPDGQTIAALLYAERIGRRDDAVRLILEARREWLAWQFRTQRKWQGHTRRPNRARHHDSIRIRESYVRIHNNPLEKP